MSTGRSLVSDIRSMNKLINSDNSITDRVIFSMLKSTASLLIKRETNLRRLWQSPNIFTTIPCIKMIQVSLGECCDYKSPCMISRSKDKIPGIAEGLFGLLIQSVYNVDGSVQYKYTSPTRYSNILKLNIGNSKNYFWIVNNYLYVSDSNLEYINLSAYFDEDVNIHKHSECSDKDKSSDCINPIDKEFKIPSYLEDSLKSIINDKLMKTYFRHIEDQTTNNRDEGK